MSLFNTKDDMVRALKKWDSKTFGDAYAELVNKCENEEILSLVKVVLEKQNLYSKRMNGFCSEGLKVAEFEGMGVCYVDFFNMLEDSNEFWTPLNIIYALCEHNLKNRGFYERKAKRYNMSFEEVTWLMCGRAIRALPSYIREYQLKNALKSAFPEGEFYQDEEMDKKFHCDIRMELNGQTYYFWSFISSQRSVMQFIDKFRNHRYGEVLDGVHVLCPFERFSERAVNYKGWLLHSKGYGEEVRRAIFSSPHALYENVINKPRIDYRKFQAPIAVDKNVSSFAMAV